MILYNMTKQKDIWSQAYYYFFLSKRGYLTTTPRLHAMMCGPGETSRTVAVRTVRGGGGEGIESVRINGVSVLSGLNLEKM